MLKLSPLFTDGAVLCRDREIRIFGEAEDGQVLRCELRDEGKAKLCAQETQAAGGRFMFCLPPQEAQEHCELKITGDHGEFLAREIAIGEVFLAGGQSNMEWELQNADEGPETIRIHANPQVRYFNVPRRAYACEEADQAFAEAGWRPVEPGGARDMSAVAYFFAMKLQEQLGVPVGIIDCYWGGTSITAWLDRDSLERTREGKRYLTAYENRAGQKTLQEFLAEEKAWREELHAWEEQVAAYKQEHPRASGAEVNREVGPCPWHPPEGPGSPYRPGALYDMMTARVVPYVLSGILWYQGESDAGLTDDYEMLLLSLAERWRTAFMDQRLPFLLVQLPMWIASDAPGDSFTWPEIRMAQSRARDQLRNCGMVCLLDQGEWDNLHPTAKRVVGERLAELALKEIYGREGRTSPRAIDKYISEGTLTIVFSDPIRTRDGKRAALMELAGPDGAFFPAEGIPEGKNLRLFSDRVPYPAHARYAWTDFAEVNLFGENGLPAEPFVL